MNISLSNENRLSETMSKNNSVDQSLALDNSVNMNELKAQIDDYLENNLDKFLQNEKAKNTNELKNKNVDKTKEEFQKDIQIIKKAAKEAVLEKGTKTIVNKGIDKLSKTEYGKKGLDKAKDFIVKGIGVAGVGIKKVWPLVKTAAKKLVLKV